MTLTIRATLLLAGCILLHGCAPSSTVRVDAFSPSALKDVDFKRRATVKQKGVDLSVSVAALTASESERIFGVPLAEKGIQPVWVKVENDTSVAFWLLDGGIDRDYFSPNEAAYKFQLQNGDNQPIERHFHKLSFSNPVEPKTQAEGFILTHLDRGAKFINVDLISHGRSESFSFFVQIPDFKGDYQAVDFKALYRPDKEIWIDDEVQFRTILEALPCCTASADGSDFGDPLNLVVIGEAEDIFSAFLRRGWNPTEQTHGAAIVRTIKAFLSGQRYAYSPVSPLYTFGRTQDIAGQKSRDTIHERNHFRLWLSPYRFRQRPVWVGQISRDIGIRISFDVFPPVTHKIDPDMDEARNYLVEDMIYTGGLARFGLVKGVGYVPQVHPRYNLGGDPYHTDGFRMVLEFSPEPHSLTDIEFFEWERPQSIDAIAPPKPQG